MTHHWDSNLTRGEWSALYFKHVMIVNDDSSVISNWSFKPIDDTKFIIYNHNMFIIQTRSLYYKNIMIVNDTSGVVRMTPQLGMSDDSRCVIHAPRVISYAPIEHLWYLRHSWSSFVMSYFYNTGNKAYIITQFTCIIVAVL